MRTETLGQEMVAKRLDDRATPTTDRVVNRWWRGVGARVVLELAIVVASYGPFGAPPEGLKAKRTRK